MKMALFDTLQATTEMIQVGIERSQAESIAKTIAKVQGDTVTKDYMDLKLSEMELRLTNNTHKEITQFRTEFNQFKTEILKEIGSFKMESQFTKWTNKAIMVALSVIASALIKIAFFH
jgi:N-acetylglutamate synthase/N-acetylornithine aminotransferase